MKKIYLFLILAISFTAFAQDNTGGVGCMDETACNFCPWATIEADNCDYTCIGCMDATACNFNPYADISAECDFACVGCMDELACNYDETFTIEGVCDFETCIGCMDEGACNFNSSVVEDYSDMIISIRDQDDYVATTGFSIGAFQDEGDWTPAGYVLADQFQINLEYQDGVESDAIDTWNDWAGVIGEGTGANWHDPENYVLSIDVDGGLAAGTYGADPVYDYSETFQWTITGWNQTILAGTIEDGRLVVSNGYRSFDGEVNTQESFSGSSLETELVALTFTGDVSDIGSGTEFGVELLSDNYPWEVCDFSCLGCVDMFACNYDADATLSDDSCEYDSCAGCTQPTACNYLIDATIPDSSCDFTSCVGCMEEGACNYNMDSTIESGDCEYESCSGCTDENACDYASTATIAADCDYSCVGCMDVNGCDYDEDATIEGDCDYSCNGCMDSTACDYDATATAQVEECDFDSCFGCLDDVNACNYCSDCEFPTDCIYPEDDATCAGCTDDAYMEFSSDAIIDNGSCVTLIVVGCMDDNFLEFNPDANMDDYTTVTNDNGTPDDLSDDFDEDISTICDVIAVTGCNIEGACNYNADVNVPTNQEDCNYTDCLGCMNEIACNYDVTATLPDESCDFESCAGCTDSGACNYDEVDLVGAWDYTDCEPEFNTVTNDNGTPDDESDDFDEEVSNPLYDENCGVEVGDGIPDFYVLGDDSCEFDSCAGCQDMTACNYDSSAILEAACDFSCWGCMDEGSCNYDSDATIDYNCDYTCIGCIDPMACNYDGATIAAGPSTNDNGTPDDDSDDFEEGACDYECWGCMDFSACNYDSDATYQPNNSCEFDSCEGCMNPAACDYNENATIPTDCLDFTSCVGCTDESACNFDSAVTFDDGSCGDICGCTDFNACNYQMDADVDNGSCIYEDICNGCMDQTACNFAVNATIPDGSCDYTSCVGCMDASACNYDDSATVADESCDFSCYGCMDSTACDYNEDATLEDICDFSCYGCMDSTSCNFDENASLQYENSCNYDCWGCMNTAACNFDIDASIEPVDACNFDCVGCMDSTACNFCIDCDTPDNSCEFVSCEGCTDATACDYDPNATISTDCVDWLSCVGCYDNGNEGITYASGLYSPYVNYDAAYTQNTYGNGAIDDNGTEEIEDDINIGGDVVECIPLLSECGLCADGTLSCINIDGEGCMDWYAVNYDSAATVHNPDSCLYYVEGCMDATACNYNMSATQEDGSCIYVDGICDTCSGEVDGTGTIIDNDSDDDTICNDFDVCDGFNDLADADGDLIPDDCDDCPNDADNDIDGDTYCGDVDAFPSDSTEWADTDGDGVGDNSDVCEGSDDNVDSDSDGTADGCDICPNDADNDIDGDTYCADVDAFPSDSTEWADTDADGVGDNADACEGSDDNVDSDSDGTADGCDVCPNDAGNDTMYPNGICDDLDVLGCTNPGADVYSNYNPLATWDDGSCDELIGCDDGYTLLTLEWVGNLNNSFTVTGDVNGQLYDADLSSVDGSLVECWMTDLQQDCFTIDIEGGDGLAWQLFSSDIMVLEGTYVDVVFGSQCSGCTDDTACNYDSSASIDDDSCEYATEWFLDWDNNGSGNSNDGSIYDCTQPDGYVANNDAVSIEEDLSNALLVYPNPATELLNIEFNSNNKDVVVEFVNSLGQLINSEKYELIDGSLNVQIDMKKYTSGIYQINLISNNTIINKTLIVE